MPVIKKGLTADIFYTNNTGTTPDLVYVDRLRSRPLALGMDENNVQLANNIGNSEVDKLLFNTGLSQGVKTLIDASVPATAFTGGQTFTVNWSNVAGASPVNSVQIQSKVAGILYQDEGGVSPAASSIVLRNGTGGWGNMSLATTSGNYNLVQLRGRDMNDLQYFHNWRY